MRMSACDRLQPGTIEQYFYGDLPSHDSSRVEDHLRACAACRDHIADLDAVSDALAQQPMVDAPPAGDWTGFMQRLEVHTAPSSRTAWRRPVLRAARIAAVVAMIVIGGALAVRGVRSPAHAGREPAAAPAHVVQPTDTTPRVALQAATAEHLERSKVVVLDLAMRDPNEKPVEWQDERRLARSLLSDTRLYRLTAEEQGRTDIARVMRDLETVLLEASMSDGSDPKALSRVQHLISTRDLLMKMQVVSAATSSGT
jgi:hypothetical protein